MTLAGMKGGLALIMIVSLSDEFIYKEMFLAVTLGVVILSIFIYALILMVYIYFQQDNLVVDKANEHNIQIKNIKELLEKEAITGAYNEIIFEDLVEKEIYIAQRYSQEFSLIAFIATEEELKKVNQILLRKSDYFGKLDNKHYAILLIHTKIDKAIIFKEKLKKIVSKKGITIAQYIMGDTKDMIYEKIFTELKNNNKNSNQ